MRQFLNVSVSNAPGTFLSDALGLAALCVIVLVGLSLPVFV